MMKKATAVFLGMLLATLAYSQSYNTSGGIRLGAFPGISVKTFLQEGQALEATLSTRWNGMLLTGMYEFQNPIHEIPSFYWYIGGGAHAGIWAADNDYMNEAMLLGGNFVLGVEYVFRQVPFTISIDWNPAVNIIGPDPIWFDHGALSFHYTFN